MSTQPGITPLIAYSHRRGFAALWVEDATDARQWMISNGPGDDAKPPKALPGIKDEDIKHGDDVEVKVVESGGSESTRKVETEAYKKAKEQYDKDKKEWARKRRQRRPPGEAAPAAPEEPAVETEHIQVVTIRTRVRVGKLKGPWALQRVTVTIKGSEKCDGTFEHECKYVVLEAFRLKVGTGLQERWANPGEEGAHLPEGDVIDGLGKAGPVDVHKGLIRVDEKSCGLCEGQYSVEAEIWDGQSPETPITKPPDVGWIILSREIIKTDCGCSLVTKIDDTALVMAWGSTKVPKTDPKKYSFIHSWQRCEAPECVDPPKEPKDQSPVPKEPPVPPPPPPVPPPVTPPAEGWASQQTTPSGAFSSVTGAAPRGLRPPHVRQP